MFNFPSYKEIVNRIRADIARFLPGTDPTIFGSMLRALADSLAGRSFDIVQLVKQLLLQFMPQTATGIFLELWAAYEGLTRNPATASTGPVTFTGTASSIISQSTQTRSVDSNTYLTALALTLAAQSISVTSLVRVGNIVTATTASDHSLGSGQDVTVAGAVETDYNGTFTIAVTAANEFTYEIAATPTTPATGTITASFDGGFVNVDSEGTGQDQNLESGAILTLASPIAGVDATAYVQFGEVGGGTDAETDDELRVRVLQSRSEPVANFNVAAITKRVLSVPGVTRLLVKRITPYIGAVTVLFVRDNDDNIIPSASEVQTVKDAILEILQASSDEADVFVIPPTPVETGYTFSAISPDTTTMRDAIKENLKAFYRDEVTFETDIIEDKYKAAISNTIDPETGETLTSFTLTGPSGTIVVTTNEIGTLGQVIFS